MTQLTAAVKASPEYQKHAFPFEVSGLMPAVSRTDGNNVMSFYLLHVARDPYWRNTPVQGQRGQPNVSQPLSLNLSYLLTSYAEKNWFMEQYLMSVALEYFHANPIYRSATAEFTVTVEADTIDEMSRLWQAIAVPIRLSALFRVAVVFLTPPTLPPAQVRPPVVSTLSVGPDLNAPPPRPAIEPQLYGVALQVEYRVPPPAVAQIQTTNATQEGLADQVSTLAGQAVAVAGERVRARGIGLDEPDAGAVFLSAGGTEWPVTAWRILGTSASGTAGDADELVLSLPAAYGAVPGAGTALANTPLPGLYQLTVGNAGSAFRSNPVPFAIAPLVTGIGAGGSLITPDASGLYTMTVSGLVSGATNVLLETVALAIGATAVPGTAVVDAAAGKVAWMLPALSGFASGTFARVRVVVNSIEAPPAWWVQIP
ncbi:Pvc16 family protein [Paraburkholderia sp. MM5482-R1]|uniref:DUF4255 domain-containing protein n=1 Tax=unclassified Paraburkholderia TaxID=2615204 RepID=UPI003D1E1E9B